MDGARGRGTSEQDLLARFWTLVRGEGGGASETEELEAVAFEGSPLLPASAYDVNALATASVAAATLAIARVQAVRTGMPLRPVRIDRRHAAAAFRSERYFAAVGWQMPPLFDPVGGDYESKDGWIRLHTNYRSHREGALRVLGVGEERDAVARAVATWEGAALETAIVNAGGCAAFMRSPGEWERHPQGASVAREPLIATTGAWPALRPVFDSGGSSAPLAGVRVLDLTRVIAGPVCTRTLAAFGADVLRIDPPGFEEVGALLGDTTVGKRRAALDLRTDGGKSTFDALVRGAHVLVHGYRPDALGRLGFDRDRLRALSPSLVVASLDAYGWTGPWAERRGFDSLVQMSCGIAWRGREVAGASRPTPLSAQALDHATGYLLAASVGGGLARLIERNEGSGAQLSLAATAACLMRLASPIPAIVAEPSAAAIEPWLEDAESGFGASRRVRYPGAIEGVDARWTRPSGALGIDEARWG
jgi:CoA-transferase family III